MKEFLILLALSPVIFALAVVIIAAPYVLAIHFMGNWSLLVVIPWTFVWMFEHRTKALIRRII